VGDLRNVLEKNEVRVGMLQYASAENKLLLQTPYHEGEKTEALLQQSFPEAKFTHEGMESVGAIVGEELKSRAILALSIGLIAIFAYVSLRYEWTFALAATVAQFHNVMVTVGILALLGHEFNMTLVGAFLTILGYSINDKIVIFDRIREGLRSGEKRTLYETINHAVSLTLARTLMTGGTVLLAIISLLVLGGTVIHGFAVAMLIGVITGIYSSHLVAPTLVLWFSAINKKSRGILMPQPLPATAKS
jgi:SecD/SecF fusion protein